MHLFYHQIKNSTILHLFYHQMKNSIILETENLPTDIEQENLNNERIFCSYFPLLLSTLCMKQDSVWKYINSIIFPSFWCVFKFSTMRNYFFNSKNMTGSNNFLQYATLTLRVLFTAKIPYFFSLEMENLLILNPLYFATHLM